MPVNIPGFNVVGMAVNKVLLVRFLYIFLIYISSLLSPYIIIFRYVKRPTASVVNFYKNALLGLVETDDIILVVSKYIYSLLSYCFQAFIRFLHSCNRSGFDWNLIGIYFYLTTMKDETVSRKFLLLCPEAMRSEDQSKNRGRSFIAINKLTSSYTFWKCP